MALEVNYTHENSGATYNSGYARVNAVTLDCVGNTATVHIAIYASKTAKEEGKQPVLTDSFFARDKEAVVENQEADGKIQEVEIEPAVNDFTEFFKDDALKADGTSIQSNAYAFLKTFEAFQDAKDV